MIVQGGEDAMGANAADAGNRPDKTQVISQRGLHSSIGIELLIAFYRRMPRAMMMKMEEGTMTMRLKAEWMTEAMTRAEAAPANRSSSSSCIFISFQKNNLK
jgi:hypothetical protein